MADFTPNSSFLSVFLTFSLVFFSILTQSQQSEVIEQVPSLFTDDCSAVHLEFDQIKSKILLLETQLQESNQSLKTKDEELARLELLARIKSDLVASLRSEVEAAQKKGTSDVEVRERKAQARATELQEEVEKLKKEKEALEGRIEISDKKIEKLNSELDKMTDEHKIIIRNTEQAYQALEEELLQIKSKASAEHKELHEVRCAWLPPWLLNRVRDSQSFVEAEWNEHGKPVMKILIEKTLEKKDQATKWAEPHIETVKTKLVPAMKEQWVMVTEYVEPHIQSLTSMTTEVFEASKTAIKPHINKVQEVADPYYQEVKRASKPYIDQVATVAKPHVEKARTVLKPYTKKAVHVYGKFLESATMYHHQVQAAVHERLKQHDFTEALATNQLVWFLASALLALPVILLSRICSQLFLKKSKKPSRKSHAYGHHHARHKGKRGHSDK